MTEDTKGVAMDNSTNIAIHNEGFLPDEDQDNDISLSITSNSCHNKSSINLPSVNKLATVVLTTS